MPNMDEVVRHRFYEGTKLDELMREFQTVPVDSEGRATSQEFTEMYVRETVLKLIADVRLLIEEREQDKAEILRSKEKIMDLESQVEWWEERASEAKCMVEAIEKDKAEQDKEIQRHKEGWEVMAAIPMSLHPSEVRRFSKRILKGGTPYKINF